MSESAPSPNELHDLFRRQLIDENGRFGLSLFGHAEELSRLKFYLDTLETFIAGRESEDVEFLKIEAARLSENLRSHFWAWNYPVHWDEIFRDTLRSSFVVSLVSFIENYLIQGCRNVEVIARAPLNMNVLRGSVLERAKVFLAVFGHFTRPAPDQWVLIERICDIRNVFVHSAGYLGAYAHEKRLRQFCRSQLGLSETHDHIHLTAEFCPFALDTTHTFLDAIQAELTQLCTRVRETDGT